MNQKDELYRALVTANQYETDFIFGKGKYLSLIHISEPTRH